ncbi:MAG TPA: iron-sulfur cluster repair di-iron protein [Terriglobia bacterium]|nr:iron-sulfur cluster repair di-iron protein [Terriglobia bacterium]
MSIDTQRTVAEIALEKPEAAAVFEKLGIDYCCGGKKPLEAACQAAGLNASQVVSLIENAGAEGESRAEAGNWSEQSLASLVDHIVQKHHAYCRSECLRLEPLLAKVISKHGEHHPELAEVQDLFSQLRDELSMHMMKEEHMLFPYIIGLEEAVKNQTAPPRAPFGTVHNPVRMMVQEHDDAGDLTKQIRSLTRNFTPPEDACNSYRVLYQGLEAFEADLHQHIHLENNLLFPRAIAMEDAQRS